MSNTMKPSPRKFQESASAMLRNMAPMLAKARSLSFKKILMPGPEVNRASQQTELIKWQQDMFHRVLNTMCLVQDNLLHASELAAVREHIIHTLIAVHPDGEWADFTRDKLLFLQDLYQARCISEDDYHTAKQPILERLAEQGAQLGTSDFEFNSDELKSAVDSRLAAAAAAAAPPPEETPPETEVASAVPNDSGSAKKKTPIKHVMDAMSRLTTPSSKKKLDPCFDDKQTKEEPKQARVPHALDFLRPPDCPTRDPPETPMTQNVDFFESPLFKHSSVGSTTRSPFPQLSSDTTDLLPQLSSLTLNDFESPPSVPSSPVPATQPKPALPRSNSLTPSKLSFTPRSALTPTKSPLGLTHSASRRLPLSASPSGKPERTLSRKFSGLLRGWQKIEAEPEVINSDEDNDHQEAEQRFISKKSVWQKLDLRAAGLSSSSTSKRAEVDDSDDFGKEISDKDPLLSAIEEYPAEKVRSGFIHGQGPNVKKLKKKVNVRAAPTNFFIDQVLGENIKTELDRIRKEMDRSNPGNQTFTNEQIDAIATRLPVDKNELMRFFPKAWCDKYGEVVLEVVHKEFKGHVSEMDGLRKASKEKRKSRLKTKDHENDENRKSTDSCQTSESNVPSPKKQPSLQRSSSTKTKTKTKPQVTRVYTTEGSDFKAASVHEQHSEYSTVSPSSPSGGRARRGPYEELDVKLGAEILRMPFRNFNESTRYS